MDIYECNERFGITLKKLRLMRSEGILKLEGDKTPKYWRQVVYDIKKGKMSARSIALAYRYPGQLEKIVKLTLRDRGVIADHFADVEFPPDALQIDMNFPAPIGAIEKHVMLTGQFIRAVQQIIPNHHVSYYYVAARLLLFTCDTDFRINLMSEQLARAFASIRDEEAMRGWWHTEPGKYHQESTIYHRPAHYDL
ncbi:MAG: hypothetical protein E7773_04685 [Sphingomonas sp.]|uniref:hypothetical protein n=1 Tax=Sphingomonas sp. TaxID=28214 RepID=UPI00120E142B|nr:hypothetical protein [Sphingomonas sp.]THD37327.1 MAG: hypothetical protein E7773_04685 [Sphingomonas sp.]